VYDGLVPSFGFNLPATAELIGEGGKTRLRATVEYPSPEVRDVVLGSGMSHGAGLGYDRLGDLLAELQYAFNSTRVI
jgi:hypothetical protein